MAYSLDLQMNRWRAVWLLLNYVIYVSSSTVIGKEVLCDQQSDEGVYNTSAGPVQGKINVHLVPHTHDDVGWLKTVDQYFVGSNNSIQVAAVQYILDSVISALLADPNRKFIYVEQAFFQRWWRQQTSVTKEHVKELVNRGQLEFINGGWCMHDEATTHYIDMIDQTTLGHRYIKEQFDKVPRIGWQIDPFGHSAVQAYLLSAEVGLDAVFFARADYQDIEKRRKDRAMEVIWRGSKTLGSSSQIFAGVLANHYEPPSGFSFDIHSSSPPVQDDPLLFDYNVEERVNLFVELALNQSKEFRTDHIMWTMGDDFAYEYAQTWFKQMDKLIHYVNKDGRVNTFYSTPSIYVDMKAAANISWPLKLDDYFPYADSANGYWTGYFTSRPALKRYVRKMSAYLQVARQLEFIVGRKSSGPNTDYLEEAMAIVQHHDGVSGTEKQHVADDYSKRLSVASAEANDVINMALSQLVSGKSTSDFHYLKKNLRSLMEANTSSLNFQQCPLSNISYCPESEADLTGKTLAVVAYNPLGWQRKEIIRITVSDYKLSVFDSYGNGIASQIVSLSEASAKLRKQHMKSIYGTATTEKPVYILVFESESPPFGYSTYYVKSSQNDTFSAEYSILQENVDKEILLNSNSTQFLFSSTGSLEGIAHKNGIELTVQQSYCWYNGSDGNTEQTNGQASGAYIFRPNTSTCFPLSNNITSSVVSGSIVQEIHQTITSWVTQVVRVYKDSEHAEVEFTVGPIPVDDTLGKEVVTKLSSSVASNNTFYTDSNGRDFIKRIRDYRSDWQLEVHEGIAGNYYPLNSGIFITDNITDFSVLVDRAVGGSSIMDGEVELMLHRRLLYDDGKGVGEALNEITCLGNGNECEGLTIQGVFIMSAHSSTEAPRWRRNLIQRVLSPLQLAFSVVDEEAINDVNVPTYSIVLDGYELPPNVAVITLQELDDSTVLLRLAHLFEVDEDEELSTVAVVDLQKLLSKRTIETVEELSLTANQKKSEMRVLNWRIEDDDETTGSPMRNTGFLEGGFLVELKPMELRTFSVVLG